jgi:Protein of unknown function (DUF1251)
MNRITVFVDDVETPFVSANVIDSIVTYKYSLKSSATNRVRVMLDTAGARLQAVFRCRNRYRCVVNARRLDQPLVFDGFVNADDESCTDAFVIKNSQKLCPDRGWRVRDIARAMESPTVLHINVNEAILLDADDDDDDDDNDDNGLLAEYITEESAIHNNYGHQRPIMINTTRWAPVLSKTGRHLLTIVLIFTNYYYN